MPVSTSCWCSGGRHVPGIPAPLSCLHGDGLGALLAAPGAAQRAPVVQLVARVASEDWTSRLQRLSELLSGALTAGSANAGFHQLLALQDESS
mmetsp:Transcript_65023/g.210605  ORF Transcript_65023/g.210605 Transcript_65023/m.210605 type:complete len:93 (+) Transcript_65023:120-398(+)